VYVKITGREKTHWVEVSTRSVPDGQGGTTTETVRDSRNGRNEFFKMRVPLFTGAILPGQFELPFAFVLPMGLPGSFVKPSHNNGFRENICASVSYKLQGYVDVAGGRDFKQTSYLVLYERLVSDVLAISKFGTSSITQCCCLNKGDASLTVRLDKNAYVPGETVQVVCEVDNRSSIELRKISVRLYQNLRLQDSWGTSFSDLKVVARQDYPGIPANTSYMGAQARYVPLPLGVIEPETHGRLVHCTYYCEVDLDVPMGGDVRLRIPVTIYAPQRPPQYVMADLPQGWRAEVKPMINVGAIAMGVPPPVTAASFADPFGGASAPPSTTAGPGYPVGGPGFQQSGPGASAPPSTTGYGATGYGTNYGATGGSGAPPSTML
jgi:hypothetical protein